jgi:hypothetical protein
MALKRRGKKQKRRGKSIVKNENLANMLRQVHLGGIIDECLLDINNGKGLIEAVDITNALIVVTKGKIMDKGAEEQLGLGNLELLIKFLNTIEDDELAIDISNLYFTLKREDGRRKLEYLLTQPDLIATKVHEEDDDGDSYKKMKSLIENSADLTSTFIKDYLNYINMLKTKDTTISFDGDELTFICGGTDDHRFELTLSSEVEGEEEGYDNKVNGEHLARILSIIDFDEDDPPQIHMAEEKPVLVEDGNALWALLPLYAVQESEDDDE